MPFPATQRVIFDHNPLIEVVLQIRFPTILAIDTEELVKFQEAIRVEFPIYEETIEQQQQFTFEYPSTTDPIQPVFKSSAIKNYKFSSDNEKWSLNLTRNFIALTTNDYKKWEDFIAGLEKPIKALSSIFKPAFYERIGLRYIDVFCRSELGLSNSKWHELIKPQALGLLSCTDAVYDHIKTNNITSEIALADGKSIVRINSSLVTKGDDGSSEAEKCLMIDCDFFTKERQNNLDDVYKKMEFLHDRSSRMIRWILKPKLYDAMEPKNYEEK